MFFSNLQKIPSPDDRCLFIAIHQSLVATGDNTLLRFMEDEQIARLYLRGRILDIGGGTDFDYTKLIQIDGNLDSINISAAVNPTIVADLNEVLPIADKMYDKVIFLNALERIHEERRITRELLRVLRPGGRFVVTIPFLFPRHGRYGDFHRNTAEYWEKELCELGLDTNDFIIKSLSCSPLSSVLAALPWFLGGIRGKLVKGIVLLAACSRRRGKQSSKALAGDTDYALGFYIDGIKSVQSPGSETLSPSSPGAFT
ncbi:class I SAM-dependent methyltransferase [Ferribacterium limneticum]|uniref:class I SAM-dependent methyltransferase n=1 Tax=Ferribacterium limneticum TaxID=76259 RepID=UPI001CF9EC26|nr:methyltransferase domain-containing protein [Ferribacterium limneticum]UCV28964.1 methyltransferase domain-containing protein [Ferribacterium limneticum]UCV32882.1 methyltransferase domain-containing protein [Ferribacterium limneticum]